MADPQARVAEALRENWFWSGVFRDHMTFVTDNLAPSEDATIRWAQSFRRNFAQLNSQAETLAQEAGIAGPAGAYAAAEPPAESPLAGLQGMELGRYETQARQLSREMLATIQSVKGFKEDLIQKKLECKVKLGLAPSLLAHMVVEAEEGQRALSSVRESAPLPPALEALHHHLVWLPDAAGHAAALHGGLDATEEQLLETTADFKQVFNGLHIKSLELYSMLRVAPRMVGALTRLNRDAMGKIEVFRAFLLEMREHLEGCEILGSLVPLFADHMLREELYYTEKIMSVGE